MTPYKQFLVHIAREYLLDWLKESGAVLDFSCRQLFHVVSFDSPKTALEVSRHPLCRYALPIAYTLPIYPRKKLDVASIAEEIARRFRGYSVSSTRLGAVHRAMCKFCEPLGVALRAVLGLQENALDKDPCAPALVVALYADRLWAGVVSARDAGAWHPCNLAPLDWLEQDPLPWISRAAVKWLETFDQFRLQGLEPALAQWWLELGAAPGGITAELLKINPFSEVTAVDVAQMHTSLEGHPRLRVVRCDIAEFAWDKPFDGLVCDVNGPPLIALDAVTRLLTRAEPGALVMFTLKVPRWSEVGALLDVARARLEAVGVAFQARHLVANRQELSLIGRVGRPLLARSE